MKKAVWTIMLLLVITWGLVFSSFEVHAQTSFNGVITSNTIWTKANSPYTFQGPVAVNQGVTLTIEPGVTVNVNAFYLQVNGTLNAIGTSSEKIVFTASSQDPNPQLKRPRLELTSTGSGSILENVEFPDFASIGTSAKISKSVIPEVEIVGDAEVTENSITKLTISGGSAKITKNEISGEFVHKGGNPTISDNTIHSKPWTRGGSPTFVGNRLNDGIHADSGGGSIIIANNEINSKGNAYVIFVQGRVQAIISNNRITGNHNQEMGVVISGILATAAVTQNQINNCDIGIKASGTTAEITKNTLTNNNIGLNVVLGPPMAGASGEWAKVPYVVVKDNTITKNTIGLQITPYGDSPITNNNIYDNSQYELKLDSPNNYTISNNYWGTTDTSAISQKIFDYKHDFNLGHVTVSLMLNSPVPQYSPDLNAPIPTFLPTITPTPYQTPIPQTSQPTQSPTATPIQPPIGLLDLNFIEIAIVTALIVVAALLAILIITLRRKG